MSRGGYRAIGEYHVAAECCWSLSAWGYFQELQHIGYLAANDLEAEWEFKGEYPTAWLEITTTRSDFTEVQRIDLTYTPCNYGKFRAWFVCPRCARRVAKLFLPAHVSTGGRHVTHWRCRHCWRVTYEQRTYRDLSNVLLWRAERVADRWLGEISKEWIGRKKGQHWRTFSQRADQYERAIEQANEHCFGRLERMLNKYSTLRSQAGK